MQHHLSLSSTKSSHATQDTVQTHVSTADPSATTHAATQRSTAASVHPPALSEHLILLHHCDWSYMPSNSNSSPAKVCTCTCAPTGRGNQLLPPERKHSILVPFTTSRAGKFSATAQCYLGTERYHKACNSVYAAQYNCPDWTGHCNSHDVRAQGRYYRRAAENSLHFPLIHNPSPANDPASVL